MEEPGIRHKTCFSSSLLLDNECMWWLYSTQSQSPNDYCYCIASSRNSIFSTKISSPNITIPTSDEMSGARHCLVELVDFVGGLGWLGTEFPRQLHALHGTTTDNTQYPALPSRTATLLPKKSPRRDCGESKAPRCVGLFVSFRPPSVSVT